MTVPFKNVVASALILLHLAVAAAPHIGHADEWVNSGVADILHSHDCGANEIHKDLKDHSDCLLCSRTTLFVGFVIFAQLPLDDNTESLAVPLHQTFSSYESTSSVFLRGPPDLPS